MDAVDKSSPKCMSVNVLKMLNVLWTAWLWLVSRWSEVCFLVLAAGVTGGEGGRGALLFDGGEFNTFMMNERLRPATGPNPRLTVCLSNCFRGRCFHTKCKQFYLFVCFFSFLGLFFSVVYSCERARVGTAHVLVFCWAECRSLKMCFQWPGLPAFIHIKG